MSATNIPLFSQPKESKADSSQSIASQNSPWFKDIVGQLGLDSVVGTGVQNTPASTVWSTRMSSMKPSSSQIITILPENRSDSTVDYVKTLVDEYTDLYMKSAILIKQMENSHGKGALDFLEDDEMSDQPAESPRASLPASTPSLFGPGAVVAAVAARFSRSKSVARLESSEEMENSRKSLHSSTEIETEVFVFKEKNRRLKNTIRLLESNLKIKEVEQQKAISTILSNQKKLTDFENLLCEKDLLIQRLQDEIMTLSLELSTKGKGTPLVESTSRGSFVNDFSSRASLDKRESDPAYINFFYSESFTPHSDGTRCLAMSDDGRLLATCGETQGIRVWSRRNKFKKAAAAFSGSQNANHVLNFGGPETLLCGGDDFAVRVFENILCESPSSTMFVGHSDIVTGVYLLPYGNERIVVSCSQDQSIRLWDARAEKPCGAIYTRISCLDIVSGSSSKLAFTAHLDGTIRSWDLESKKSVGKLKFVENKQIYSLNTKEPHIIIATAAENTIGIIDERSGDVSLLQEPKSFLSSSKVGISPFGYYVSAGTVSGAIFTWDLRKKHYYPSVGLHCSKIVGVHWHPSAKKMYSAEVDGLVAEWSS